MKSSFYFLIPVFLILYCSVALAQVDITNNGGNITSQYSDSPQNEGLDKVIDNKYGTKFLTFHESAWIQFESTKPCVVTKYAITSANDSPERDPLNWTFAGSKDGKSWKTLDIRNNEDFAGRFHRKEFTFENKRAYRFYRLEMKNNSETILQIAEWEIYGPGDPALDKVAMSLPRPETFEKNGYTLTLINQDSAFDKNVKEKMVETFFTVYPLLISDFNAAGTKAVTFFIDLSYTGVAEAANGTVRFNPNWFRSHPKDIDCVTHEVMHIIQAYPMQAGPGWLTEGIADYVRYKYGLDNAGGGWSLPDYKTSHSYTNSYRVTARFLAWVEKNVQPGIVKELDSALRAKKYSEEMWTLKTGKTIDELWQAYSQNPAL